MDKLNDWLSLGANLGVLLGIIFLSMQISQANRIATGTMEKELRERFSDISDSIIENPEFAVTWAKLQSPNPELSNVEQQQVLNYARNYWLFFVSVERAFDSELLSEESLEVYLDVFPSVLGGNPGFVPFFKLFVEGRSGRMAQIANEAF